MSETRFSYKPGTQVLIVAPVLFGACGAILVHAAQTNEQGLILNGVLEFGVEGATRFYWILALAAFAFVLAGILAAIHTARNPDREVIFYHDRVFIPGALLKKPRTVQFAEIRGVVEREINGTTLLELELAEGRKRSLVKSHFASGNDYEKAKSLLLTKR